MKAAFSRGLVGALLCVLITAGSARAEEERFQDLTAREWMVKLRHNMTEETVTAAGDAFRHFGRHAIPAIREAMADPDPVMRGIAMGVVYTLLPQLTPLLSAHVDDEAAI